MISQEDCDYYSEGCCAELAAAFYSQTDGEFPFIIFSDDKSFSDWSHAAILVNEDEILDVFGLNSLNESQDKWGAFYRIFDSFEEFQDAVGYQVIITQNESQTAERILETIELM